MLRANVVARGPHLPLWQGLTPHVLLRDFFDADELLLGLSKIGLLSIFLTQQGVVHVYVKTFSQDFYPDSTGILVYPRVIGPKTCFVGFVVLCLLLKLPKSDL